MLHSSIIHRGVSPPQLISIRFSPIHRVGERLGGRSWVPEERPPRSAELHLTSTAAVDMLALLLTSRPIILVLVLRIRGRFESWQYVVVLRVAAFARSAKHPGLLASAALGAAAGDNPDAVAPAATGTGRVRRYRRSRRMGVGILYHMVTVRALGIGHVGAVVGQSFTGVVVSVRGGAGANLSVPARLVLTAGAMGAL